jgi:plastocyanin domain-containing protein
VFFFPSPLSVSTLTSLILLAQDEVLYFTCLKKKKKERKTSERVRKERRVIDISVSCGATNPRIVFEEKVEVSLKRIRPMMGQRRNQKEID